MQAKTLQKCIGEAKRFIKAAESVGTWKSESGHIYLHDGKASGAARRASMDLTRALADLRQNR